MRILIIILITLATFSCKDQAHDSKTHNPHVNVKGHGSPHGSESKISEGPLLKSQEKHLTNLRQLTFGGDNAEAYWSFDNKQIVFQARN